MVQEKVNSVEKSLIDTETQVGDTLSVIKDKVNAIGRVIEEDKIYQI